MHKPDFLDRFDRLVAFDAETTGKRTPDADFIRRQPFAWKPPGIIIEVGFRFSGLCSRCVGTASVSSAAFPSLPAITIGKVQPSNVSG